jgi:molybdate transport system substrate-binding protein
MSHPTTPLAPPPPRGPQCREHRLSPLVALLAAGLLVLAGCGSNAGGASGGGGGGDAAEKGTLTVLGAASLTEAFTTLAEDFEAAHPGTHVRLAFDSSATLAEQVNQGAPADVLATADTATMQTVRDAGNTAGKPQLFATNHLELVVPRDNPAGITKFADLDKPGVKYVVCVDTAPCGKLARTVLSRTGITHPPASEEVDVKAVESKVQLGEADAGIVYATDVVAAGDKVKAVDIPTSNQNLNSYPIAALEEARKPALAEAWVRLVLSAEGRKVLAADGFGKP